MKEQNFHIGPTCPMSPMGLMAIAVATALTLNSCSKESDNLATSPSEDELIPVCVNLNGFEIQEMTRASLSEANAKYVSFAVFNEDDERVVNISQKSSDEGFGTISCKLKAGDYTFVAVAHDGDSDYGNATISSTSEVSLPKATVNDTFTATKAVTVSNSMTAHQMTLTRAIAMLQVKSTDNIPESAKTLRVTIGDDSKTAYTALTLNPETGLMSGFGTSGKYVSDNTFKSDAVGYKASVSVPILMPAETASMAVKIEVMDGDDKVVYSHDLGSVAFKQNRKTVATGKIFGSEWAETFSITDTWDDALNIEF